MAATSLCLAWRSDACAARRDALMVALAAAHAALLIAFPVAPVIALGVWWNSNTIAHNFVHRPFFRSRAANRLFSAYLSALLGIPQSLWRDRHLAHHAGVTWRLRLSARLRAETALVLALWAAMATRASLFFLRVYLPGYLAGLALCWLHGHYEHARGTTSHYGALYNLLAFNDGYHAEHHANPAVHWSRLPERRVPAVYASAWPAPLRWLDAFSLEGLERLVLKSRLLQRFVLRAHARAFRGLLRAAPDRVAIVGGGLFPRTAMVLGEMFPAARLTIIDANRANLDRARTFLGAPDIEYIHATYPEGLDRAHDLLVIPLAFDGDREAIYAHPPAPLVAVHDWIWRSRGASRVISFALLKRLNVVRSGDGRIRPNGLFLSRADRSVCPRVSRDRS